MNKKNKVYIIILISLVVIGVALLIIGYAMTGVSLLKLLVSRTAQWVYIAIGICSIIWLFLTISEYIKRL